ncbi:hypothetical protein FisN_5Lh027 [Fistulifera solaris]|uniref:Uncharacterized protein n=1 Tax=Fistulifera solaris TaxID=1519565 RepID=A0A1Z5JJ79_FISSO|nr:hypothetical protein FisN_5Lh027 [Fistulifera solaris]|eukprot:GAX14049.1 hypothetical protein FisN_5Lh027 [Fistulifera solaris]
MADDDSFGITETPWDSSEVDFDAEMIEDDNSVIDGVVDDDFLMSLDDNESLAGIIMQDDVDQIVADDDFLNDDELNRDPLDDEHHFHTNNQQHKVSEDYSSSMYAQHDPHFQRQQPQRYHSLQPVRGSHLPARQHSFTHQEFPRQRFHPPQRANSRRGRLSHSQSATYAPTHFAERIPDRILENAPSFYSEHPMTQNRSFMVQEHLHEPSEDPCRSPVPNEINLFEKTKLSRHNSHTVQSSTARSAPAFRVTPEASNSSISLPDAFELQVQYQRTLKRLGQSMRRSDYTRALVNRQRSGCSQMSNDSERSAGVFRSNEPADVEEARRRLYQLIHHEN